MKRRMSIGIAIALLLGMMLFSVASAHAELVSSDPAAGAKLTAAPAKVTLVFNEEISDKASDSFFNVTNTAGANVGSGKLDTADLDHKTLSGTLNAGLSDGIYTVTWQTITPDDNGKSEGSFTFGINVDPSAQPTATPHEHDQEPTAVPAAAGAAQATAVPQPQAAQPATLPKTGENAPSLTGYFVLGAALLLVAGLLLGARKRV
jgi:copper resistance protein C